MPYQPPVRDYALLLRDLLELERYADLPAFADASMDTVDQIIEEAGRFTGEVLAPLNSVGDKEGCHWAPDFTVTTPKGFKEAYRQLVDGGVLIVPVGSQVRDQRLERWQKSGETLHKQDLGAVRFVPMVHAS